LWCEPPASRAEMPLGESQERYPEKLIGNVFPHISKIRRETKVIDVEQLL